MWAQGSLIDWILGARPGGEWSLRMLEGRALG